MTEPTPTPSRQLQLRPSDRDKLTIDLIRNWLDSIGQDTSDTDVLREALEGWRRWYLKAQRYY